MRIAVIGATGFVGSAIAHEVTARGHQLTALTRSGGFDATDPGDRLDGHDAVIAAVKGDATAAAHALLAAAPARLVFVGGGGSLTTPDGTRLVDLPTFPEQYRKEALDAAAALDVFRAADTEVNWSFVSPPPAHLVPGDKAGGYRAEATDTPLVGADGDSRITTGDLASAILDAVENGTFRHQRFSAAY
ncbi:NAD-dependent dehydratase [Longispora fulva]|uniref:Putative NADH-flavin reductase n=1 Tax=Longispora fulva TaxID=619741 RepID=A0A8J7GJN5_9ACTN|nr:NAD(P)H-binding protein [Longispora fulva]MBG6141648.1 putative NADH-flavin reductase [Longispora fulva]GIG59197.1 NAD-dependent dehydratase [Longispora fulva]